MKKIFFTVCLTLLLLVSVSVSASASTLHIEEIYQYAGMGTYVPGLGWAGVLNSQLDGSSIPNGIVCVDVNGVAYKKLSIKVKVYTHTAGNARNFRLYNYDDNETLLKYQKAAWLHGQMYDHKSKSAGIHFAIWELFRPSEFNIDEYDPELGLGSLAEHWLASVNNVTDLSSYNFSSVRVFTNAEPRMQKLMSVPVPIPPTVYLLGAGLLGLIGLRRKYKG